MQELQKKLEGGNLDPKEVERAKTGQVRVHEIILFSSSHSVVTCTLANSCGIHVCLLYIVVVVSLLLPPSLSLSLSL